MTVIRRRAHTYDWAPWTIKREQLSQEFIKITHENRPNAIVLGRIFYVFVGLSYQGSFSIDPCFTKGWWRYPRKPFEDGAGNYMRTFFPEDKDRDNHNSTYKAIIDRFINEGSLYIRPSDPVLKYYKE